MSWGYRIMLLFTGFAALMITLVYKATHTKYELVSKDYYADELRYQEKIDGMNNASVAGNLTVTNDTKYIRVQLPASITQQPDSANAWFYCKTNASHDVRMNVVFVNGSLAVDRTKLFNEQYEFRLQFVAGKKRYHYTQYIDLR